MSNQDPSEDEPREESHPESSEQAPAASAASEEATAKTTEEEKESIKLIFDTNKHITTLSAGSSLLLVTFMKDLLPKNAQGGLAVGTLQVYLIVFSFLCFGLVICLAAYAMHKCSIWMRNPLIYRTEIVRVGLPGVLSAELKTRKAARAYETSLVVYPIILYVLGLSVFSGVVMTALF